MRPGRIIRVVDVPRRRQIPEPTRVPVREPQRRPVREPVKTRAWKTSSLFRELFGNGGRYGSSTGTSLRLR